MPNYPILRVMHQSLDRTSSAGSHEKKTHLPIYKSPTITIFLRLAGTLTGFSSTAVLCNCRRMLNVCAAAKQQLATVTMRAQLLSGVVGGRSELETRHWNGPSIDISTSCRRRRVAGWVCCGHCCCGDRCCCWMAGDIRSLVAAESP